MKSRVTTLIYCLLVCTSITAQQGSSCSNPIPITLDDVCRDYTISTSTGGNVVCASTGSSPITYFSVTSNSAADNILLNITGPNSSPVEVAMYTNGTCTNPNLQSVSSMCFTDGNGLWAHAETFTVTANTTYILRIKTTITGTIRICGKHYTPTNNDCFGAKEIGPILVFDNNACHKPGTGITPGQLCASSLENTAFYTYTVETTGPTALSIENATCDNGTGVNSIGFQVGFFTGSCSSLFYIYCYAGFGSNIQIVTGDLDAGTKIYVAIDGMGGSNCEYGVRAINSVVLSASIKNFTGWQAPEGNILNWVSYFEFNNERFEIERSDNGIDFFTIGSVNGELNSNREKTYSFVDRYPSVRSFYRLKQVDINGKSKYFNIITINRSELPYIDLKIQNPVTETLMLNLQTNFTGKVNLKFISMTGAVILNESIHCKKGYNQFHKNLSTLPSGKYLISVEGENAKTSKVIIKTTSSF